MSKIVLKATKDLAYFTNYRFFVFNKKDVSICKLNGVPGVGIFVNGVIYIAPLGKTNNQFIKTLRNSTMN